MHVCQEMRFYGCRLVTDYFASEDKEVGVKSLFKKRNATKIISEIHKLLSVDLIWEYSLLCKRVLKFLAARQNIGKFEYAISRQFNLPRHHRNTDCMDSAFKVHFLLSVWILGFIFNEKTQPCQFWDSTFLSQVPWSGGGWSGERGKEGKAGNSAMPSSP